MSPAKPVKAPNLKPCAPSGAGVHVWLFYAACKCVDAGMDLDEAEAYIEPLMTRRPAPPQEVRHALESASGERPDTTKWPMKDFKLVQAAFARPLPPWKPIGMGAEEAIDILFPGNPLLCVGKTSSIFTTKQRNQWRGRLAFNSLIVPSPMTALLGKTNAGHMSAHSLANTGRRRFLVIEFDWGSTENQLRLHQHLAESADLTAIVSSGGKSIHGWYYAGHYSEKKLMNFMTFAVSHGADHRTWLKSQFVRLPGGLRDNGNRQEILFLDPATIKS